VTSVHPSIRTAARRLGMAAGMAAGAYAAYAAAAWARYGHVHAASGEDADRLLDRVMPRYDIAERHRIDVGAPADTTFAAACEMDLMQGPIVRAIFRGREVMLSARPDADRRPRALLPFVGSLGWRVLAEIPGREVVMGAVTKPWEPNPTFRGMPADAFAACTEPGVVKIAWTLRADPTGPSTSVFRTETRAVATDAAARARFRRYWAFASPGIILIRWLILRPLKVEAERRADRL
jgi:hypothetical protein